MSPRSPGISADGSSRGSGGLQIEHYRDPTAFRERLEPRLLEAETEHNLMLSVVEGLSRGRSFGDGEPYLLLVVREGLAGDGEVVGGALRTPPHFPLLLSRLPSDAGGPLAEQVAAVDPGVSGVMGPVSAVQGFADAWSAHTGAAVRPGRRQRIYELTEVVLPPRSASGRMRQATPDELDLMAAWGAAFDEETDLPRMDSRARAKTWLDAGGLFVWEDVVETGPGAPGSDPEPVCMAAAVGFTRHGARIGFVYTPRERRGHGYGTACTAALSQRLLDEGRRFCCLYTDLANPTSNRIYQQIGYRPVCDVAEAWFEGS